jgi:hypothetical protein
LLHILPPNNPSLFSLLYLSPFQAIFILPGSYKLRMALGHPKNTGSPAWLVTFLPEQEHFWSRK